MKMSDKKLSNCFFEVYFFLLAPSTMFEASALTFQLPLWTTFRLLFSLGNKCETPELCPLLYSTNLTYNMTLYEMFNTVNPRYMRQYVFILQPWESCLEVRTLRGNWGHKHGIRSKNKGRSNAQSFLKHRVISKWT